MKVLEGKLTAKNMKVAIVVARFNEFITGKLLSGAVDCLKRHEADEDSITVVWVPARLKCLWRLKSWLKKAVTTPSSAWERLSAAQPRILTTYAPKLPKVSPR